MSYLKRNVNFGLLLLIIATLILFTGFSIYYQKTFTNLSVSYESKVGEIDKLADYLGQQKSKLNQTTYQLQVKSEREKDLSSKYTDLRSIKEQLEVDKATLESQLADTINELNTKKSELKATEEALEAEKVNVAEKDEIISEKNSEINSINDQKSELCSQLEALGATSSYC